MQFDEVPIAMLCDPDVCRQAKVQGGDPVALLETYISLLRRIAADRPTHMRLGLHLCRGNFRGRRRAATSRWRGSSSRRRLSITSYWSITARVPATSGHCAFCPGIRRPCSASSPPKPRQLEGQDDLLRRIEAAARVLPIEQLGLSTQCGFASVAGGNILAEDEQWAKLELVVATAERAWGRP